MKKRLRIIIPLLVVLIIGIVAYYYFQDKKNISGLTVSGNIEINEAQMSFRIPGRLEKRLVDEGDPVTAGQLLASLDKTDQELAVTKAEASLTLAQARLAELEAGSRSQEIENAKAQLMKSLAAERTTMVQLQQAEKDFRRYQALFKQGGISKKEFDQYNTRFIAAQNNKAEAQAGIRSAQERLSLLKAGARKETIDQAKAQVRVAREALKQARQQVKYTSLYSPMNGVVLSKAAEPGEYLNPASPVVTIGDTDHPWLRAYIQEKYLGRIHRKQKVEVTTDAYPDKTYPGLITFISDQAEFTPKAVQTFEERVKLMYRIKIRLNNPDHELKPGMPGDAYIDFHKQ